MDDRSLGRVVHLFQALQVQQVEYILVGGLALGLQGLARATQDVNLFVQPTPENIDRLRRALRAVWDDPHIEEITHQDLAGEYPVVRYGPPQEDFLVDVLAGLGEAFRYEDLEGEVKVFRGVPVRVATPRTLFRMKRDTVRPQDRADSLALWQEFREQLEDLAE